MKTLAICAAVLATLEGLHWFNHLLSYVVAALLLGWCLGRLWEAGTNPNPPPGEGEPA